jgi:hypothetical protein
MTAFQRKKLIYINSNNRDSGTHSDMGFKIDLKDHDVDSVVVLQANIPKSFYMVQNGYNTMTLSELGTDYTITIPEGNYTRNNLRAVLTSLMIAASGNSWIYTVSFPSVNQVDLGKYTYTVSGNGGDQPSLSFGSVGNIHELLGFDSGSTNAFVGDSLTSKNVVKLMKEDSIYIHSDLVGGSALTLLQEVYAEGKDFDHVVFINQNAELYAKPINSSYNNTYRFYITNENGESLNLNGLNWTMTLCIFHSKPQNVQSTPNIINGR